jgi:hypothetical protein
VCKYQACIISIRPRHLHHPTDVWSRCRPHQHQQQQWKQEVGVPMVPVPGRVRTRYFLGTIIWQPTRFLDSWPMWLDRGVRYLMTTGSPIPRGTSGSNPTVAKSATLAVTTLPGECLATVAALCGRGGWC